MTKVPIDWVDRSSISYQTGLGLIHKMGPQTQPLNSDVSEMSGDLPDSPKMSHGIGKEFPGHGGF